MTLTPTPAELAARAARDALANVGRGQHRADRRPFTISKFGYHEDGYLHARVVVAGRKFYFHCKYGSWMAPGRVGGRQVLKEPEAILPPDLGVDVKFALAERARSINKRGR